MTYATVGVDRALSHNFSGAVRYVDNVLVSINTVSVPLRLAMAGCQQNYVQVSDNHITSTSRRRQPRIARGAISQLRTVRWKYVCNRIIFISSLGDSGWCVNDMHIDKAENIDNKALGWCCHYAMPGDWNAMSGNIRRYGAADRACVDAERDRTERVRNRE